MDDRQMGFNRDIAGDADDAGIVREQKRLAVGRAVHLDADGEATFAALKAFGD